MKALSRSVCLLLALCLLIVGLSSPLAGAGSASLRIPALAFRPRNSNVGFSYYSMGSMYATSTPYEWWSAPVYLPQGAVVTSVRMYYFDSNTTSDCQGLLDVINFATEYVVTQWSWHSSGSAGLGYADSGTINHTVDNTQYGYVLLWQPTVADPTMRLEGFQIFYTPPPGRAAVIPLF